MKNEKVEKDVLLTPSMKVFTVAENSRKDEPDEKPPKCSLIITLCDYFMILVVVLVNVIAFWRGLFGLLLAIDNVYQLCFAYFFGCLLHYHFAASRRLYKKYLLKKTLMNTIMRKAYTYGFGSACVIQWAGLWYMLDAMSGFEVYPPLTYSIIGIIILVCFKLCKNLIAVPLTFTNDSLDMFFEFKTMFGSNPSKKGTNEMSLYILDCFFSVFVIGSLVVIVWRGVWTLTDVFLFPGNQKYSAFGSLVIGYVIVIIIFCLQSFMEKICEKLSGVYRIIVADIYIIVSFVGSINLWRGIWNLLNIYFLPENPLLSNLISHLGSFVFLVLINCSNSILVRGVLIDGDEGGKCVSFPVHYLRQIFQEKKKKEINNKVSCLSVVSADVEKGQKKCSEVEKTAKDDVNFHYEVKT